ncbi:hypothetical protein HK100_005878 [Physocladia obscura]|uniref:F-box domain-containing protein n=1 Tax=Physocladia obscura TaxID=109957 RepID=A0AAD5T6L2_9FUNG|nr:hypothetical protein HK100_005878 [Physocladia obscura]
MQQICFECINTSRLVESLVTELNEYRKILCLSPLDLKPRISSLLLPESPYYSTNPMNSMNQIIQTKSRPAKFFVLRNTLQSIPPEILNYIVNFVDLSSILMLFRTMKYFHNLFADLFQACVDVATEFDYGLTEVWPTLRLPLYDKDHQSQYSKTITIKQATKIFRFVQYLDKYGGSMDITVYDKSFIVNNQSLFSKRINIAINYYDDQFDDTDTFVDPIVEIFRSFDRNTYFSKFTYYPEFFQTHDAIESFVQFQISTLEIHVGGQIVFANWDFLGRIKGLRKFLTSYLHPDEYLGNSIKQCKHLETVEIKFIQPISQNSVLQKVALCLPNCPKGLKQIVFNLGDHAISFAEDLFSSSCGWVFQSKPTQCLGRLKS